MPIYEYRCLGCNEIFEDLIIPQRNSLKVRCPTCGGERVKRLYSVFGLSSSKEATTSRGNTACGTCTATSCSTCR